MTITYRTNNNKRMSLAIIKNIMIIKTFKASQYNHIKDEYIKCDLNERSKDIGGYNIQRDLYSAFLLMNADDSLMNTDRNKCNQTFDNFLKLHDKEILRLSKQKNISCIGI